MNGSRYRTNLHNKVSTVFDGQAGVKRKRCVFIINLRPMNHHDRNAVLVTIQTVLNKRVLHGNPRFGRNIEFSK